MSPRAEDLSERLRKFNNDVMAFVQNCAEEDWSKRCSWEDWTVGVVARHIGAGHYEAVGLARMIVDGEKLPELTEEMVVANANQHAREHAGCTREEVLDVLKTNGEKMLEFVAGLDDSQLDRKGYLTMLGGEVTAQQFMEAVVLQSGGQHFDNMKAAVSA